MFKWTCAIIVIILFLEACTSNVPSIEKNTVNVYSELTQSKINLTLEHPIVKDTNAIYCATFLLCWDELRKYLGHPIIIPENKKDLILVNNSTTHHGVLQNDEYNSQVSVEEINITAIVEFEKLLPFPIQFNSYENSLIFQNTNIESFGVDGHDIQPMRNMVNILHYNNDDNFILKLIPSDPNHEIILFKTSSKFKSLGDMNNELIALRKKGDNEKNHSKNYWRYSFESEDEVIIPKIYFNVKSNFETIEGSFITCNGLDYFIQKAEQRILFILNEKGALTKSQVEISLAMEDSEEIPHPKKMIFDKPFYLILKRYDSNTPYLALWISNPELFIPSKN